MFRWYYPEDNAFSDLGTEWVPGTWRPMGGYNIYDGSN